MYNDEGIVMLSVYAKYIKKMSNENKTIHDFELKLICDFFSNMERQGPGSPDVTLKALSFIDNLTDKSLIADIGCGTGGQTMVLAGHIPGQITGLDLFPDFIDIFNRNAKQAGLQDRVKGIVGSMDNLPFQNEELDLIWSEGAIYNIGFERGLNEWRRYLKPGGYIAVSESSWFTDERPAEINDFWVNAYPEIDKQDIFLSLHLFCRKIAGQSITLLQRLKLRKSSFINMREIRSPKNSVRFSLMKKNYTVSIKHSTVIHFSLQKR